MQLLLMKVIFGPVHSNNNTLIKKPNYMGLKLNLHGKKTVLLQKLNVLITS